MIGIPMSCLEDSNNLPDKVVQRARGVLDQLENQNRERPASTLIDDLPLFSAVQPQAPPANASASKLQQKLDAISTDELTPREALDLLYELKSDQ